MGSWVVAIVRFRLLSADVQRVLERVHWFLFQVGSTHGLIGVLSEPVLVIVGALVELRWLVGVDLDAVLLAVCVLDKLLVAFYPVLELDAFHRVVLGVLVVLLFGDFLGALRLGALRVREVGHELDVDRTTLVG